MITLEAKEDVNFQEMEAIVDLLLQQTAKDKQRIETLESSLRSAEHHRKTKKRQKKLKEKN